MGSRAENSSSSRSCVLTSACVWSATASRALTRSSDLRPRRSAAGALLFAAVAVLLIVFFSSGVAATLIDTGAYLSRDSKIYWISDDTLIFGGYDGEKGVPRQLRPPWPKPIYTARFLEYRLGRRGLFDQGLIISAGPCFDGGFVRYAKPVPEVEDAALEGKWQAFYGKYGQETPLPPQVPRANPGHLVRSFNCKFEHELPALPEWAAGKQIKALRPEHGFLEFAGGGTNWYPIRLIRSAGGAREDIALKALEGLDTDWPPVYEPSRYSYLIGGKRPAQHGGVSAYELWRLSVDGKLQQLLVMGRDSPSERGRTFRPPSGNQARFAGPVSAILPLGKDRYVFDGGTFDKRGRLGDSGLYLLDANGIEKLAKGRVSALALSPNGCRAAMGIDAQDPIGPDQFRVHIVDTCER